MWHTIETTFTKLRNLCLGGFELDDEILAYYRKLYFKEFSNYLKKQEYVIYFKSEFRYQLMTINTELFLVKCCLNTDN
jgi:hypothetical protein